MAEGKRKKIAVLGAGIIGLSTAVRIQDADPSLDITIFAENFSPHTTSDGAAGFWEPVFVFETPIEKQRRWGKITFDYLKTLLKTEAAYRLEMMYCSGYILSDQIIKMPALHRCQAVLMTMPQVPGAKNLWQDTPFKDIFVRQIRLSENDLRRNFPSDIIDGYLVTSIIFPGTPYLHFTLNQFQQKGGKIIQRRIKSFDELAGKYDVIVNCTGLGSHELCKDQAMVPVRGQIIKMKAPWLKHFYMIERKKDLEKGRPHYIFPRCHDVVVGGTCYLRNWNTNSDERDTQDILDTAAEFEPTIKSGEILETWVGLRPGRTVIRLEKEEVNVKSKYGSAMKLQVVHNYGHGGAGLSVFWGCAQEARDLVFTCLLNSGL